MFSVGVRLTMEDGRGRGTTHLNPLDRVLRCEMNRLLDRLRASTKRGLWPADGGHLRGERLAEIFQQVHAQGVEFPAIGLAIAGGRGTLVPLAELDEQLQRRHLDRLLDPLGKLRLDALEKAAGIIRPVAKTL